MRSRSGAGTVLVMMLTGMMVAACGRSDDARHTEAGAGVTGALFVVPDTMVADVLPVSGIAQPVQQSTLSTKLMGTVTAVSVVEGATVRAGQVLVARGSPGAAGEPGAGRSLAGGRGGRPARREDPGGPHAGALRRQCGAKAQLDAAETGLARAQAGMDAARAAGSELAAVTGYAEIRAPFSGRLTRRFVDVGAFAAPGAPLVTVEDGSRSAHRRHGPHRKRSGGTARAMRWMPPSKTPWWRRRSRASYRLGGAISCR